MMAGMGSLVDIFKAFLDISCLLFIIEKLGVHDSYAVFLLLLPVRLIVLINQSYIGYLFCLPWLCYRTISIFWLYRKKTGKLKKKLKNLLDVRNSVSAKLCGLKTPLENVEKVVGLTLPQLRQRIIVQKDLTALDAVEALQVHALRLMEDGSGCISEIIFDADVTAILADQALTNEGPKSRIHGIPISVANCISVQGEDCTGSLVFRAGRNETCDSGVIKSLKQVGAIPFLSSNISPLPGFLTTCSKLYGQCIHPTHTDRSVGGSCGGEAVLLVKQGSVLGFGVDTYGDARIPAAFCGVAAFKPTYDRISNQGVYLTIRPPYFLLPTVSLLALNSTDITDALESLCCAQVLEIDPILPKAPFKLHVSSEKLTIGIYSSLPDLVPSVPSVERAMDNAKNTLIRLGHTVVEFKPPSPAEALVLAIGFLSTDKSYWNLLIKENMCDSLSIRELLVCSLAKVPFFLRTALCSAFRYQQNTSDERLDEVLNAWRNPISIEELNRRVEMYRAQFFEKWDDEQISLLICPPAPSPSLFNSASFSLKLMTIGYTILFNLLNCPAGVISYGKVTSSDADLADELYPKELPTSLYGQLLNQQKSSEGLPLSVQVVSKPWQDELVLKIMSDLELTLT